MSLGVRLLDDLEKFNVSREVLLDQAREVVRN
jgi:hypothetical protein